MAVINIRFVSANEWKCAEATAILGPVGVAVHALPIKVEEIQTEDTKRLVKDKTLKAFRKVGRPLFVEHTGLYLKQLNELPGGLTQVFWDRLRADRFAELFGSGPETAAVARTVIGYTDSRTFLTFEGEILGKIAREPRGSREFQWDCVFIPENCDETFAEMGERKNDISMRRKALDEFAKYLSGQERS